MFKTISQKCALVLGLSLFAVPVTMVHAQSTGATPNAVTGGDPQPPGEPPPPPPKPKSNVVIPIQVLTALAMVGLA